MFPVTGANQNAPKLQSIDLVNITVLLVSIILPASKPTRYNDNTRHRDTTFKSLRSQLRSATKVRAVKRSPGKRFKIIVS